MGRPEPSTQTETRDPLARRTVEVSGIVLASAVLVILLWYIGGALLVIFAAILLAALLDAAVVGLGRIFNVHRAWRFGIVLVIFALAAGSFIGIFGILAVQQSVELMKTLDEEVQDLRSMILESELGQLAGDGEGEGADGLAGLMPDPRGLLSGATSAVTSIFGVLGSAVLIVMLGIFLAYDPRVYRDGFVRLLPVDKRKRTRQVLGDAGGALRWWILGIAINMSVIGVFTTLGLLYIGVPHAVVLGVQAGLLAFIPTIGPVLAAIPIILVSLAQDYTTVLWALGLYLLVQILESNVLTPLVQMEMVSLYPGTILIVQLIMVGLYGAAGLALATPLAAVGKVLIRKLYVEDWLEAGAEAT